MAFEDPKDVAGRAGPESTRGRVAAVQAVSETSGPVVVPRLEVARPGLKTSAEMLNLIADRARNIELREAIEYLPEGTRVQYLSVKVGVLVGDADKPQDIRTGFGTVLGYLKTSQGTCVLLDTERYGDVKVWLKMKEHQWSVRVDPSAKRISVGINDSDKNYVETAWIDKKA